MDRMQWLKEKQALKSNDIGLNPGFSLVGI